MTKQLLIYDKAVPVSPKQHLNTSVKFGADYSFAREVNSVPLMSVEFEFCVGEYAIVFAGEAGTIMPVAMLGVRDHENLYVGASGEWLGKYIPAFLRRYPFVFSSNDDGKTFTLCVDEDYSGVNTEGRGERLFDSAGERTQYLQNVLNFLQAYQVQFLATRKFVQMLEELQLFDPMEAQFTLRSGQQMKLGGFKVVNRERLRQLDGQKLAELARSGGLDLIYSHLHSLRNFTPIAERMAQAVPPLALPNGSTSEALESAPV
ncbi:SapC family protein [Methyloferula stellata]|uniref:SapC family protein n=1 Tax=Methyloferula stellata TaxID=876270 RepID=UPI000371FDA5|nr:SapC family protein [Methyloferula stellata]